MLASTTFGTGPTTLTNTTDNPMAWAASPTRKAESMFSVPIIQMGHRAYLPTLGRFLQVDPVEGGTDNAYSYVNDPVNEQDYSGQFSWGGIVKAVAAVAVVVAAVVACIALCVAAGAAIIGSSAYVAVAAAVTFAVTRAPAVIPRIVTAVRSATTAVKSAVSSARKTPTQAEFNKVAGGGSSTTQVTRNLASGKAAEQQAQIQLERAFGKGNVYPQEPFTTPLGKRVMDFVVKRSGQPDLLVEVKSGMARYGGAQLSKDAYLVNELGYDFLLITIK